MSAPQGVYWIGGDNNIYTKVAGQNGVKNVGPLGVTNLNNFAGLTEINDPSAPAPTTSITTDNGTGSGSGSGSGSSRADLSSYDQSIDATNAQLNDLPLSLTSLLGGADANYQTTVNGLTTAKATADRNYNTNKTSDAVDYNGAKNTIRTNTGATINGIDSVIGSRGGGGQTAGDYAALLAGKAGTAQLGGAGTNFGKNEQALDTGYNDFLGGYDTNMKNAGLQHDADVNGAQAKINTQKATLLQSLATLINERTAASGGSGTAASQPYVDQAKQLLASAAALGVPKTVAPVNPVAYTPPALSTYTTNPTKVTPGGNAATDTTQPFYAALLNRDKQLQAA